MLDQVLQLFRIVPDHDLDIMKPGQTLTDITARADRPDRPVRGDQARRVLVHGDTTTAMAAALAAFYARIPVGHVEAGLRTDDLQQPWPEEMNRRSSTASPTLLFAPTESVARQSAARRAGDRRILVTGNTVIDALLQWTACAATAR